MIGAPALARGVGGRETPERGSGIALGPGAAFVLFGKAGKGGHLDERVIGGVIRESVRGDTGADDGVAGLGLEALIDASQGDEGAVLVNVGEARDLAGGSAGGREDHVSGADGFPSAAGEAEDVAA